MLKNSYKLTLVIVSIIISITSGSCKKTDPITTGMPDVVTPVVVIPVVPSITAGSPTKALPNSTLTITGKNFPITAGRVIVNFGTITATIASITSTEIVVHIPATAKSGAVIAIIDGSALVAASNFTVLSGTQSAGDYTINADYLASDALGNVYNASNQYNKIYKTNQAGVTTLFSSVSSGGRSAVIDGFVVDASGNVYVTDRIGNQILKVTSAGVVSVVAGTGVAGYVDGPAATAQLAYPSRIAIDAAGNLYTSTGSRIRKISASGVVSTLAGGATTGNVDGAPTVARFGLIDEIILDKDNNLLVSDAGTHTIRKVTPAGDVSTFAGTGVDGWADGTVKTAQFRWPQGMAFNANGDLFVSDNYFSPGHASKIRMINKAGLVTTFMTGDFSTPHVLPGALNVASTMFPDGLAFSASGNMYITNTGDGCLTTVTFK